MKPLQALLALFACAFLPLNAASLADLTWTTTDGKITITDCDTAATGELVIPNTIGGNPVTSIGDDAFRDCGSLTSIKIPDGVTSIGVAAFRNCSSLTSMTIPDSVTSIGDFAFGYCDRLTSITIPDGVTSIGNEAFFGCTSLTSITIGNGVKSIGEAAFYFCTSLTSITIPDGVTSIGDYAFWGCTSLTSITIPDGVTSIGDWAFRDCSSLTSITIGNGVTSIGNYAFGYCDRLTRITFQGVAPTVGIEAFSDVADGAVAYVTIEALNSFGGFGTDWNGLTVSMSASYLNELSTQVAGLSQRPTAEQLATVEAERDARFTENQIRTMSEYHTVGQNEAGNMQLKIGFIQSADLNTYTPFTVSPDSLSVIDGKICMEFPPSDDENFFFRFRIE
jgi:hypothetical protein